MNESELIKLIEDMFKQFQNALDNANELLEILDTVFDELLEIELDCEEMSITNTVHDNKLTQRIFDIRRNLDGLNLK